MDVKRFLMLFILQCFHPSVIAYTMDKHILNAANTIEVLDKFHVMQDGMMKVTHELDMLLSFDQYRKLYMNDEDNDENGQDGDDDIDSGSDNDMTTRSAARRAKRKAIRFEAFDIVRRWPDCKVYYEITKILDTRSDREIIRKAMDEWEEYTCLVFEESSTASSRIQFQDGDACRSEVGMQLGGPQSITLGAGCRTKGIIVHEIGHAIGWFHEHSRPDRDNYVNVIQSLIPVKYRSDYQKYTTKKIKTYGIPYDYTSVMHYGGAIFPGAMVARDPTFQSQMGQRKGLSFKDIKLANVMYNCAEVMKCQKKDCKDGFQLYKARDGEEKCQCWCDSGSITNPLVPCSKMDNNTIPTKPTITVAPPTSTPKMECMDVRNDCKKLKEAGKCESRMSLMNANCAKTCEFCGKGEIVCMDYEAACGLLQGRCNDEGLRSTMSSTCMATCDQCPLGRSNPCEIYNIMMGDIPVPANGAYTPFVGKGYTSGGAVFLSVLMLLAGIINSER